MISKRSKEKFCKLLSTTFYRFKHENCLFGWVFRPCINATITYCISSKYSQSISCILLWITKNRRRPIFYPIRLRIRFTQPIVQSFFRFGKRFGARFCLFLVFSLKILSFSFFKRAFRFYFSLRYAIISTKKQNGGESYGKNSRSRYERRRR